MSVLSVPLLFTAICLYAMLRGTDVFSAMVSGAKRGLKICAGMLPALTVLLAGVSMLRASGLIEAISVFLSPVFSFLGIPAETAVLLFLRPFSGSGALAFGSELISAYGPDSYIGRCAAVMLGSTETTFYVTALYFSACGIKKTRHAIPSALTADLVGFIMAALTVRLILS